MKNILKKPETQKITKPANTVIQKQKNIIALAVFVGCISLITGCVRTASVPLVVGDDISVEQLLPQASKIVQDGLADEDPLVRVNAIEVVAAGRQTKLMPKVRRLLWDDFVPVRFAAALAIGDLEYSLWKNEVKELLKDQNENVRIAAVYAMKKLGSSNDLEPVRKAIGSSDSTVRANAALLLGKSGDQSSLKLLYWALRHQDSDDKVRLQAMEAIAMLGDERIYPKLLALLVSARADDRVMGIKAMGKLGTEKAKEALFTKLDDAVPEVRLAAAEQLGALGNTAGEPDVFDVFRKDLTAGMEQDGAERIKVLTAFAIGQIGTPSLTKFLPNLLNDQSKFVRLAAAKAVFQCAVRKR
jgi:HEAT repeat protein